MKKILIEIEGITPLLMNKYNIETELSRQKGKRITKTYDPEEEAEKSAYWSTTGKKQLIIPAEVIYAAMLNASSFHRIGKRSAKSILAGSIRISPFEVGLGTAKYEIDTRAVVIQRARVLKSRPRLDKWKASFELNYPENLVGDPQIIRTVLEEAGQRVGLMDFRPQRGGGYGTFKVTKFEAI